MPSPEWFALPADVFATIVLSASSVLFGLALPLAAGVAVIGVVRGLVDLRWGRFAVGLLFTVAVVAGGVALRAWGSGFGTPAELAGANQTAAIVFTAVTPLGVLLGVVMVVVALVSRYVGGALERRRRSAE